MVKLNHKNFKDAVPLMLLKICIVCERKRNKAAILTLNKKMINRIQKTTDLLGDFQDINAIRFCQGQLSVN